MIASGPSLKTIFDDALEIESPADRAAYLDRACEQDADLRAGVENLLRAHDEAGRFLDPAGVLPPAAAALLSPLEAPGTVIGSYKLVEQIGEGGMGLVFMAEQSQPVRRLVALKVLKPGLDTRHVLARFDAERQALAMMDHPHIAQVFDAGTTPAGRPYFVMELVRGVPITDFCDQHRLDPGRRLELFVEVCRAVQHAHQKGVIHRDLKPSNVLVTLHDTVAVPKVIDFGIAKATGERLTERTLVTNFAQMIGTPLYMSPEQAEMNGLDVDTRSDVYALGVLLYELLTGATPFDPARLRSAGYDEVRRILREEEPPRPSRQVATLGAAAVATVAERRDVDARQFGRQLRGDLDWVVMKALEKDRNRRYESASAFAQDVERYLAGEAVQARPPSTAYRLRKFAGRNKVALITAGLAAALCVTLGWWAVDWGGRRALARRVVKQALAEADDLQRQANYAGALSSARRAEGLAAGDAVGNDLRHRAERRRAGLELLEQLDEVRLEKTAVSKAEKFDQALADRRYAEEFRAAGIDVDALTPEEAAGRLRESAVAVELALALDSWAADRREEPGADWKRLLRVARLADPEAWRCRLRGAVEAGDRNALVALAKGDGFAGQPARSLEVLGDALWKADARQPAIAVFREAIRSYPGDFWVNYGLGRALVHSGPAHVAEGLRFWTAAVALRPQSPGARLNLGAALADAGELDEAIACDREAIRLKPDYVAAHSNLGHHLVDKGRAQEALAVLQKALPLNQNHANTHNNLGRALSGLGRSDEAIAAYREAIRLRPDSGMHHDNLGLELCLRKRDFDGAITCFRESVRLNPHDAYTHCRLGMALGNKGLYDEAVAEFREAARLKPKDAEIQSELARAHLAHGVIRVRQGRVDDAIASYREAIRLKPDLAEAHNGLGAALCDGKGEFDGAIASFREALRLRPNDPSCRRNLGVALSNKGLRAEAVAAFREAVAAYEEALRGRPDDADLRAGLAQARNSLLLESTQPKAPTPATPSEPRPETDKRPPR